jgi:pyruvate/2-oxoglutarate dehydrogenase complex dihydrolipoamide acyltransferase (E2) component
MLEAPYAIAVPQETVNDESVRIAAWKVASGSIVENDQIICEIETSKAVIEVPTPVAGVIRYEFAVGDEVQVSATLCEICPIDQPESPVPAEVPADEVSVPATLIPMDIAAVPAARLTPLARKLAIEFKIDPNSFPKGSIIRKNDVLKLAGQEANELASPSWLTLPALRPNEAQADIEQAAVVPDVPITWSNLPRKKVLEGKILRAGRSSCIQSSVTAAVKAPQLRNRVDKLGLSFVGLDALIIFEMSRLMRKYPQFNAVHDRGKFGEYQEVNVGWAVDSGQNLAVPVIKSADKLGVREIAAIMERQLEAYLENKLSLQDISGGTVTISNLSNTGVHFFDPLVSQGQSAILGIASAPGSQGGETFYLTLAFDHQLSEGRLAANFLADLSERIFAQSQIEEPRMSSTPERPIIEHCILCNRDIEMLLRYKAVLLQCEVPKGLVCSHCVAGF